MPPVENVVVISDNASIHTCELARAAAKFHRLRIPFPPPYHPQFNPIEMVFGWLKKHLPRFLLASRDQLAMFVRTMLAAMPNDVMKWYFRHSNREILDFR